MNITLQNSGIVIIIIGAILLLIGIIGGGIEVKEVKVPKIDWLPRTGISLLGAILLLSGIGLSNNAPPSNNATPTPTLPTGTTPPVESSTLTPGMTPTPGKTPTSTWKVILNHSHNSLTYKGYTVNDTKGHHFLIIDASFENVSSTTQSLGGNLFDLQDEHGNHYSEDQASNPGQSFAVDPGQSIETSTAFVVPNSSCKFTLSFIAASSVVTQWTINSGMCS